VEPRHEEPGREPRAFREARAAEVGDLLVAYFSLEVGVDERLPIYAGGLGLLAGDHLKAAADLGVPLVGVGLLYRRGYFRQELDESGRQRELYEAREPHDLSLAREPATVPVELAGGSVEVAVWRADIAGVPLFLLDTDLPTNAGWARRITEVLYGGDRELRIAQEIVLGVGGVRALVALGRAPTVFHLNEGHAAFAAVERVRRLVEEGGLHFDEALAAVRRSTVFTTHTPVRAGNETFDVELVRRHLGPLVTRLGISWDAFAAIGRSAPEDDAFGLTPFALRLADARNAVSRLHGEVAREMWAHLWPDRPVDDIPIGHVTNGVHPRTWISSELAELLREVGVSLDTAPGKQRWKRARNLDLEALRRVRRHRKQALLEFVRDRAGDGAGALDVDVLTVGFARRFATYKRAGLLFSRPERLVPLLTDERRPLQVLVAGKAHPADEEGKALLARVVDFARSDRSGGRVVFLEDYDIPLARALVQGVDVWLNLPRRREEASGTSGMKAALNGALNLSILDGWWDEGYDPDIGWAIPATGAADPAAQDEADAAALFRLLEEKVLPAYYGSPGPGGGDRWLSRARAAIAHIGEHFTSHRMVAEYAHHYYLPAHSAQAATPRPVPEGR
jgi:starch phosphorylase